MLLVAHPSPIPLLALATLARRPVVEATTPYTTFAAVAAVRSAENVWQCNVLRCIFANPFRPLPPVDPAVLAWQDATLVRLALAAYEEREVPSGHLNSLRLCVLADAMEEAGGPAELVAHLRDPGPHVRGCWCVDLLLGES